MNIIPHPGDTAGLRILCSPEEQWRLEAMPAKSREGATWHAPVRPNVEFLRANVSKHEFSPEAIARIKKVIAAPEIKPFPGVCPGTPMAHQKRALDRAWQQKEFFFAHAMGTGKTYTTLTLASELWRQDKIDGFLVLCPATIRRDVWEPEIGKWMTRPYEAVVMAPGAKGAMKAIELSARKIDGLKILVAGIETMSNKGGKMYRAVEQFLQENTCAMYVDESSRIKTPNAKRTKTIIDLGGFAEYRWCGTGTKITQGIHDLYSQFRFLHWNIIGHKSYYSFKNRYCKMGGFEGRRIVGYDHVNELMDLVSPYIDVVRKEDANDLPPKVYLKRHVESTTEQRRAYKELTDYMETTMDGEVLEVGTILERMTRYQQIAGGNFPHKAGKEWTTRPLTKNPKIDALLDILADTDESVIIWARFQAEVEHIRDRLRQVYGDGSVVAYYGPVSAADRKIAISRFQAKEARFFVANQATASIGLTLTAATVEIYYSNSFSLEDRVQSEDRAHRTGQTNKVTIVDLLSDLQIDKDIQKSILSKKSMATYVADNLKERA